MTRFHLAAAAIAVLIAVPAGAADMRAPVKAPVAVAPACANFGGIYIGAHGGWTYYDHHIKDRDQFTGNLVGNFDSATTTDSGWHAGGQVGYNWQRGCMVFGVQVDASWSNAEVEHLFTSGPAPAPNTAQWNSQMRWFGTLRSRTGVVVSDLLLYVTGGFAFANIDRDATFHNGGAPGNTVSFSNSDTRWGFVVGAGTEWSLSPNWSFVGEVLYMGFKKDTQTIVCPTAGFCGGLLNVPARFEFQDSAWVGRVGLNYRFGGGRM